MSTPDRIKIAMDLFAHAESLIRLGETRANIFVAGNAALLIVYLRDDIFRTGEAAASSGETMSIVCCGLGMLFALAALIPHPFSTLLDWRSETHSYYFGCIGRGARTDLIQKIATHTEEQHIEEICNAVHLRAKWAKIKFTLLLLTAVFTGIQFAPILYHTL